MNSVVFYLIWADQYRWTMAEIDDYTGGYPETREQAAPEKKGIVLVAFGTSHGEAMGAFDHIERMVKDAFPGVAVFWAFTSSVIRRKLTDEGHAVYSPAEMLARMGAAGFTRVAVQSLHVIPGQEYEGLRKTINAFLHMPKGIGTIRLGRPLLFSHNDIKIACERLSMIFPCPAEHEAVVLMGHGTSHPSNVYYPGIQYYLWQLSPRYWLATVEGYPSLQDILPKLKEQAIRQVRLVPFLSVAGNHARDDMAGEKPDSWKSILEARGFRVCTELKGLAEYDGIASIWVDHLKDIV